MNPQIELRPQNFDELLGQQHIVKSILESLSIGKPNKSFIFYSDTPGVGKTSMAYLLRHELERRYKRVQFYEILMATNSTLDEIKKEAQKIYSDNGISFNSGGSTKLTVVDEAHNTGSKKGFDVFLQPTESDDLHITIFCTTEYGKIPATLKSRSLSYYFGPLDYDTIYAIIERAVKEYNLNINKSLYDRVIELAKGSARTALTELSKLHNLSKEDGLKVLRTIEDDEDKWQKLINTAVFPKLKPEDRASWSETITYMQGQIKKSTYNPEEFRVRMLSTILNAAYGKNSKNQIYNKVIAGDQETIRRVQVLLHQFIIPGRTEKDVAAQNFLAMANAFYGPFNPDFAE